MARVRIFQLFIRYRLHLKLPQRILYCIFKADSSTVENAYIYICLVGLQWKYSVWICERRRWIFICRKMEFTILILDWLNIDARQTFWTYLGELWHGIVSDRDVCVSINHQSKWIAICAYLWEFAYYMHTWYSVDEEGRTACAHTHTHTHKDIDMTL